MKTKSKRYMRGGVGSIEWKNNTVVTTTNSGDVGNYDIVLFNRDGKSKRRLAHAVTATIKGNYIYYIVVSYKSFKYKVFRTNLKGKKKKAVTKWLSKIPSKYSSWE